MKNSTPTFRIKLKSISVIEMDVIANNKIDAYTSAKSILNSAVTFGDKKHVKDTFELSREIEELPTPIANGDTPPAFTSQSLDRFDG